jgi:hypothetical protein
MLGTVEFEARAVEIRPAPIQHFFVDIDSDVSPGKCFVLELIVPQRMSESPATAADVHDGGIQAEQAGMERVRPEIASFIQIKNLVGENPVSHAHTYTQVVRRDSRKFLVHTVRQQVEGIHNHFEKRVVG